MQLLGRTPRSQALATAAGCLINVHCTFMQNFSEKDKAVCANFFPEVSCVLCGSMPITSAVQRNMSVEVTLDSVRTTFSRSKQELGKQ